MKKCSYCGARDKSKCPHDKQKSRHSIEIWSHLPIESILSEESLRTAKRHLDDKKYRITITRLTNRHVD